MRPFPACPLGPRVERSMNEPLTDKILAEFGADPHTRLFRNVTAKAWTGAWAPGNPGIIMRKPRMVQCGLCIGSSDIIGIHKGRFVAIEVKEGRTRTTEAQENFVAMVRDMGGIAGIVRSVEEVRVLLT